LRVKVASTSDARLSSNVGNTTAALKKSRHLFRVEISGPFYNKTGCAIESMQAAEEEDARGTVQQRCAYRPARRQDQFSTERDDLCRNLYNEQRCRMPPMKSLLSGTTCRTWLLFKSKDELQPLLFKTVLGFHCCLLFRPQVVSTQSLGLVELIEGLGVH